MVQRLRYTLAMGILLAAACAPAPAPLPTAAMPTAIPAATDPGTAQPTPTAPLQIVTVASSPQPVATSRGPDLEATNPATVSLASGGLQLVEFFRFT